MEGIVSDKGVTGARSCGCKCRHAFSTALRTYFCYQRHSQESRHKHIFHAKFAQCVAYK